MPKRAASIRRRPPRSSAARQVNVRVDPALFQSLEAVARDERRSIGQTVCRLVEEAIHQRRAGPASADLPGGEIGRLAAGGKAFDWLADEPDLYDDASGEPV